MKTRASEREIEEIGEEIRGERETKEDRIKKVGTTTPVSGHPCGCAYRRMDKNTAG